jgi:hypothetical protein
VTELIVAATTHLGAMEFGAFWFGAVLGWNAYFINRYRKDVLIGDLAAIVSAVGGSAILALFKAETVLFAYYGMGLGAGFFGYFVVLILLVWLSKTVGIDWFLTGDGRPMFGPEQKQGRPDPPL